MTKGVVAEVEAARVAEAARAVEAAEAVEEVVVAVEEVVVAVEEVVVVAAAACTRLSQGRSDRSAEARLGPLAWEPLAVPAPPPSATINAATT